MPKNILSLEPSFGASSTAWVVVGAVDFSEAVEGAVDATGEGSWAEEPDDADAMVNK